MLSNTKAKYYSKNCVTILCIAVFLVLGITTISSADKLRSPINSQFINMSRSSCAQYFRILAMANNDTVCTINGVRGKFKGAGESGRVTNENGVWVFRGKSCQSGVGFWVSCFRISRF